MAFAHCKPAWSLHMPANPRLSFIDINTIAFSFLKPSALQNGTLGGLVLYGNRNAIIIVPNKNSQRPGRTLH
jgi:hypothetical protein